MTAPARMWRVRVLIDNGLVLELAAPLAVAIDALGRTLSSVDSLLYPDSHVEITIRPSAS